MKILVDVKRVVQEIDLDTQETYNFIILELGGFEHRIAATEEQLQRAIMDAKSQADNIATVTRALETSAYDEGPNLDEDYGEGEEDDASASFVAQLLGEGEDVHTLVAQQMFTGLADLNAEDDRPTPPSSQQQRKQNIRETRADHAKKTPPQEVIAAMRRRARKMPARGLAPHQVDEAGNPVVPQQAQAEPSPPPPVWEGDDDGFAQG